MSQIQTYGFNTPHYRLPVKSPGQISSSTEDMRFAMIIENQIRGLMQILGNGIYEEGQYIASIDSVTNDINLALQPTRVFTARGIIDSISFRRQQILNWNLPSSQRILDREFYFYITLQDGVTSDPSLVIGEVFSTIQRDPRKLLVAVVWDRGDSVEVVTDLVGKYIWDIGFSTTADVDPTGASGKANATKFLNGE